MKDKIHEIVVKALKNDGWKISADPFYLPLDGTTIEIDLEQVNLIIVDLNLKIISTWIQY